MRKHTPLLIFLFCFLLTTWLSVVAKSLSAAKPKATEASIVFEFNNLRAVYPGDGTGVKVLLNKKRYEVKFNSKTTIKVRLKKRQYLVFRLKRSAVRFPVHYWFPLKPGETATVFNHPCCSIQVANVHYYDPELASCAMTPAGKPCGPDQDIEKGKCECPKGSDGLYPGLANDPRCGTSRRCIKRPLVRWINTEKSKNTRFVHWDTRTEEPYRSEVKANGFEEAPMFNTEHNMAFQLRVTPAKGERNPKLLYSAYVTLVPAKKYSVYYDRKGIEKIIEH